ncbi:FTR1 family iron permease [Paenibacillus tyrfis]|uniref:FTR1 family iron permease n=1 Tax=Paenibacillus tyrfis TaxID=1501230 RepID=UPI00209D9A61|nr:FTR1 family protein [Paenibacillus tyrfis]MCP1311597.1 FTR1 family iron permease [Paenibacillus tyrfis]
MILTIKRSIASTLFILLTLLPAFFTQQVLAQEYDAFKEKVVQTARFINTIPVEYSLGVDKTGEVMNWGEYKEAKIYVGRAKAEFNSLSTSLSEIDKKATKKVKEGLDDLTQKINDRDDPKHIASLSAELSAVLLDIVGLSQSKGEDTESTIEELNASLDRVYVLYQQGDIEPALTEALNSYALFGPLESKIAAKNQKLLIQSEQKFARLRELIAAKASPTDLQSEIVSLQRNLQRVEELLTVPASPISLFFDSLTIILREGLEAILVIGALTSFLIKSGHRNKLKSIYWGAGGAIAASLITAVLLQTVLTVSGASREVMEGVTMIVAAAVLIWASYWLIGKAKASRWKQFVEGRMKSSIATGSLFALGMTAFLAVYREGFETILFYQAIYAMSGSNSAVVVGGLVAGLFILAAVYYSFNRYAVKIPLKPYFLGTSILLNVMAFRFLGYGIRELQFVGSLNSTEIHGMPEMNLLGIYPTVEAIAVQSGLLIILFLGLVISVRNKYQGESKNV